MHIFIDLSLNVISNIHLHMPRKTKFDGHICWHFSDESQLRSMVALTGFKFWLGYRTKNEYLLHVAPSVVKLQNILQIKDIFSHS